eukprot:7298155-Prymnesium_polylepis.1
MDADAISNADELADVADASHVVHNRAGHSWTIVVPPEQPAAVAQDHSWETARTGGRSRRSPRPRRAGSSRAARPGGGPARPRSVAPR